MESGTTFTALGNPDFAWNHLATRHMVNKAMIRIFLHLIAKASRSGFRQLPRRSSGLPPFFPEGTQPNLRPNLRQTCDQTVQNYARKGFRISKMIIDVHNGCHRGVPNLCAYVIACGMDRLRPAVCVSRWPARPLLTAKVFPLYIYVHN